jgi:phosphatidate cytidylyltransferase
MLRQRILTAIVIIPLSILVIWFGNPWFGLIMALFALFGSLEFYRLASSLTIKPLSYFGVAVVLLLVLSPFCSITMIKPLIITIAIIISLIWLLFRSLKTNAFNNWAWTMAGILFIGWTLSYWIEIRDLEFGRYWVFWIFTVIVVNDVCALFIGKALGKHPLALSVSPKKTWEGAIGGLVTGIIVSVIFGSFSPVVISWWQMIILGLVICLLAQLGDLVESLLKRNTDVKDSGKLLPGHGGSLDRLDSFFFTGPVLFYCITYIVL